MTRAGLRALRERVAWAAKMLLFDTWPRPRQVFLTTRSGARFSWWVTPPLKRGQKRRGK